jgi:hypothetical protein
MKMGIEILWGLLAALNIIVAIASKENETTEVGWIGFLVSAGVLSVLLCLPG